MDETGAAMEKLDWSYQDKGKLCCLLVRKDCHQTSYR
jgi:hypothetical protein